MLTMAISLSSILLQVRAAETHQEKAARLAQDNARHAEVGDDVVVDVNHDDDPGSGEGEEEEEDTWRPLEGKTG